jgi:hypothetical protein
MAHTCNPIYSGGSDQDCSSKLAWANSSVRPYLEKSLEKRAGEVTYDVGCAVKPQYHKINK